MPLEIEFIKAQAAEAARLAEEAELPTQRQKYLAAQAGWDELARETQLHEARRAARKKQASGES